MTKLGQERQFSRMIAKIHAKYRVLVLGVLAGLAAVLLEIVIAAVIG